LNWAATAWLVHSTTIAQKHYWQVTNDDFTKAAQNPAQQAHVTPCKEPQAENTANVEAPILLGDVTICDSL